MFQVIWVKVCFLEQRLDKRSFKHTLEHTRLKGVIDDESDRRGSVLS